MKNYNTFILENKNNKVIAYHGTPYGIFDKFEYDKRGTGADQSGYGDYGNGFYFTRNYEEAKSYAVGLCCRLELENPNPYVYTCELDMKNTFNFEKKYEYQKRIINFVKNSEYNMLNIPDDILDKIKEDVGITEEDLDFISDVEDDMGDNWADFNIANKIKEKGYDSFEAPNGEIVIFDTEQIKIIKRDKIEFTEEDCEKFNEDYD